MKHILTAILIFFTGNIFLSKSACNDKKESSSNETEEKDIDSTEEINAFLEEVLMPAPVSESNNSLSKAELEKKLIVLSQSEAPTELAVGAMCYKVARPADRYEYVCPNCQEKTLHTNNYAYFLQKDLGACRSIAKNLSDFGILLDETNFCTHCQKERTNEDGLCIIVEYEGVEEKHRCCSIRLEDLKILDAFFKGKTKYTGSHGNEIALKTKQERLEYLLNIEISE